MFRRVSRRGGIIVMDCVLVVRLNERFVGLRCNGDGDCVIAGSVFG